MLGGAKRVSMARQLADAARKRGFEAHFFSYELTSIVPIASMAEVIIGRRWADTSIIPHLIEVIKEKSIDIVIPFVDPAIAIAAQLRQVAGVFSPVSSEDAANLMFDKIIADEFVRNNEIPVPRRYFNATDVEYPAIYKPRCGSASQGIIIARTSDDEIRLNQFDDYLVQEYIANRREYTVDCYISNIGTIAACSVRLRRETLGGEASLTTTVACPEAAKIARQVIKSANLHGAVTVQVIEDCATNRFMFMECNPRLGGGAVIARYAGVDIPDMIIADYLGLPIEPQQPAEGITMSRYMHEVIFQNDSVIEQ